MSEYRVVLRVVTNLDARDWNWEELLVTDPTHEAVEVEKIEVLQQDE